MGVIQVNSEMFLSTSFFYFRCYPDINKTLNHAMSQVEHARIPNESVFSALCLPDEQNLTFAVVVHRLFLHIFLFFETSIYFASGVYKVEIRNRKCGDFVLSFG